MTIDEIKEKLKTSEYDFLRHNPYLSNNIIMIGLGGSYAYGTNNENSDIDMRGCALNSKREILLNKCFEQVVDVPTDTVIYSFNKLISLFTSCNPNAIELIGLKPEQYLYLSDVGKEMIDNRKMFLSKLAVKSFGGYAYGQLKRLDNKAICYRQEDNISIGKRNKNAIIHGKLGKHMMHLLRLYMMCVDILEKEEINTYRENEHELLMDIRNGKYLENGEPVSEFFEIVEDYKQKVEYAEKNTSLPEKPDYDRIDEFVMSVNERVVKGEL